LQLEDRTNLNVHELVALSQLEQDELLARQLMESENRSYRSQTNYVPHQNQQIPAMISMDQIDVGVVNELLNQVKSTLVPFIKSELQNFKAPNIEEQMDTGKFGEVAFSLKDISFSDVAIPEEGITMKLEGPIIRLEV